VRIVPSLLALMAVLLFSSSMTMGFAPACYNTVKQSSIISETRKTTTTTTTTTTLHLFGWRKRFYKAKAEIVQKKPKKTRKETYYDILGASPKATRAELKAKYVSLVRQTHPDAQIGLPSRSDLPDFSDIATAWKTLSDKKKRLQYDRNLMAEDFTEMIAEAGDLLLQIAIKLGTESSPPTPAPASPSSSINSGVKSPPPPLSSPISVGTKSSPPAKAPSPSPSPSPAQAKAQAKGFGKGKGFGKAKAPKPSPINSKKEPPTSSPPSSTPIPDSKISGNVTVIA